MPLRGVELMLSSLRYSDTLSSHPNACAGALLPLDNALACSSKLIYLPTGFWLVNFFHSSPSVVKV